jgi:hypothetical protein
MNNLDTGDPGESTGRPRPDMQDHVPDIPASTLRHISGATCMRSPAALLGLMHPHSLPPGTGRSGRDNHRRPTATPTPARGAGQS